jgi:hypothetical protein
MTNIGWATLSVIPSAKGFGTALSSQVDPQIHKSGASAGKAYGGGLMSAAKSFAAPLAGLFAVSAVADFAKQAIGSASDLAESQSKVAVVFGSSAKAINDWASTSSTSMLMSSQAALEAAGTYGNLFQAFGIGQQASEKMSKTLVQLAADLASFNNTSVDDALLALRSGLSGETEPLKRYGIAITDARLKQEALSMGIADGKATLDAAQKAQASYSLILKDTTLAQGDVKRTSDGYANTVRAVTAEIENQKAVIGGELLKAIQSTSTAMGGPSGLVELTKSLGDMAASAAAGVAWLTTEVVTLSGALPELIDNENLLWTILKSFPAVTPTRAILAIGDAQRDGAAKAADMSYQNRLLNQALNLMPYAATTATDGITAIGDAAATTATGIGTLRDAIDALEGRSNLRSSSLSIRGQWAALADMGDMVTVGKPRHQITQADGKKVWVDSTERQVRRQFDPDVARGRFANTDSGRAAEQWALDLAAKYQDRATLLSEQGRNRAAMSVYDRGRARLAGQFGEWELGSGYAQSFLPRPQWLVNASGRGNLATDQYGRNGVNPGQGTTINYQFMGDIVVPTVAEAGRRAIELARLKALSGGQIPAAAS